MKYTAYRMPNENIIREPLLSNEGKRLPRFGGWKAPVFYVIIN